jgi:hypothetical protein
MEGEKNCYRLWPKQLQFIQCSQTREEDENTVGDDEQGKKMLCRAGG